MKILLLKNLTDRNKRKYSKEDIQNFIDSQNVSSSSLFGHLGFPMSLMIDLTQVSHMFESIYFEGNDLYGDIKILDTPMGKILSKLIDEGFQPRGTIQAQGKVDKNNNVTELKITTFNIIGEDIFVAGQ